MAREHCGDKPCLPFRIGLCSGLVWVENAHVYGNAVNTASRIQALAKPRKLAVTRDIHDALAGLFRGHAAREIAAVAKPGEPALRAVEIDPRPSAPGTARAGSELVPDHRIRATSNVVLVPCASVDERDRDRALLLLLDEFLKRSFLVRVNDVVTSMHAHLCAARRRRSPAEDYLVLLGGRHGHEGGVTLSIFSMLEDRFVFSRECAPVPGHQDEYGLKTLVSLSAEVVERSDANLQTIKSGRAQTSFRLYLAAKRQIQGFAEQGVRRGIELLRSALMVDPEFARALSLLAKAYSIAWRFNWASGVSDPLAQSIALAQRAVEINPCDALCEAELGFALFWGRERQRALMCYQRALQMDPGNTAIAADVGMVYSYLDLSGAAIEVLERSLSQDGINPDYRLWSLCRATITLRGQRQSR